MNERPGPIPDMGHLQMDVLDLENFEDRDYTHFQAFFRAHHRVAQERLEGNRK